MEGLETSEPLAEVIPLHDSRTHLINGVRINLGKLSMEELVLLDQQCIERLSEARFESSLVQDEMNTRRAESES